MADFLDAIRQPNTVTSHTDHVNALRISDEVAISVSHISKVYKLYDRNRDRLNCAIILAC